ncbi:hypothetical protein FisN_4Hh283 [Fistulifera solaris]|uniref:Molybdate-anion transporter n=1 Tax=Fistulifera solaris TaxID=1519565 RepID=A0A1Z5KF24_FISSO|nr:hypothetical protein FisN_4Hh283 [Fistulifera solaris]|eukprot:GAX24725.1 hypothetical protein FisN_4Hh283 [Fistulifera solaris]
MTATPIFDDIDAVHSVNDTHHHATANIDSDSKLAVHNNKTRSHSKLNKQESPTEEDEEYYLSDTSSSDQSSLSNLSRHSTAASDDISVSSFDREGVTAEQKNILRESSAELKSQVKILRVTYLLVTLVIMLADGLQGTHLYVLYESYGFSVATLYCLGFATGGLMSPVTGPLVDYMGRKKAALLYCGLEAFINLLEQYPFYYGLVASRMIGGFTTNLLMTVFETWLDTEYRNRGLPKEKYELILRDSVIVSNLAAIFSGYLAHILASRYGAVGPFRGAVTCTVIAFIVVLCVWTENYGSSGSAKKDNDDGQCTECDEQSKESSVSSGSSIYAFLREAICAYANNSKMLRVGILQGLTAGCLQIFVYLWVPCLRHLSATSKPGTWGLDEDGEPAYGLIFGAYMACGVAGGLLAPRLRSFVTSVVQPLNDNDAPIQTIEIDGEGTVAIRPMSVEVLAATCYMISTFLLFVPVLVQEESPLSFSNTLVAFLVYELMIGIFLPCEGVIRSLYFPSNARASIMTLPRIIVNFAVALGVVSTNIISVKTAFGIVGTLMAVATILQVSLVSQREWSSLFSRVNDLGEKLVASVTNLSSSLPKAALSRRSSVPSLCRLSSANHRTYGTDAKTKKNKHV